MHPSFMYRTFEYMDDKRLLDFVHENMEITSCSSDGRYMAAKGSDDKYRLLNRYHEDPVGATEPGVVLVVTPGGQVRTLQTTEDEPNKLTVQKVKAESLEPDGASQHTSNVSLDSDLSEVHTVGLSVVQASGLPTPPSAHVLYPHPVRTLLDVDPDTGDVAFAVLYAAAPEGTPAYFQAYRSSSTLLAQAQHFAVPRRPQELVHSRACPTHIAIRKGRVAMMLECDGTISCTFQGPNVVLQEPVELGTEPLLSWGFNGDLAVVLTKTRVIEIQASGSLHTHVHQLPWARVAVAQEGYYLSGSSCRLRWCPFSWPVPADRVPQPTTDLRNLLAEAVEVRLGTVPAAMEDRDFGKVIPRLSNTSPILWWPSVHLSESIDILKSMELVEPGGKGKVGARGLALAVQIGGEWGLYWNRGTDPKLVGSIMGWTEFLTRHEHSYCPHVDDPRCYCAHQALGYQRIFNTNVQSGLNWAQCFIPECATLKTREDPLTLRALKGVDCNPETITVTLCQSILEAGNNLSVSQEAVTQHCGPQLA